MNWEPRFELGVSTMDAEHKGLVAAMNEVFELDARQAGKATVDAAIQKLAGLTKQHFADEEAHMQKVGFADLRVHQRIHAELLQKFTAHYTAFQAGQGRVDPAFFDFLKFWLRSHITGVDRQYVAPRQPAKV
ncbi:MAG: hemerythrin family protein [Planctomycetes bacterium]|nr:hemerythrin family protein [Planctomycetota bacterium]